MVVQQNKTKEVTRASTEWCKVQFAVKPELQSRDLQKKKCKSVHRSLDAERGLVCNYCAKHVHK